MRRLILAVGLALGLLVIGTNNGQAMPLKDTTLVVYYAEWCGPCKAYKKTTDTLSKEGVCVYRVDITKYPNPEVTSIPRTFIHDKAGKVVKEFRGFKTPEQLRKIIEDL